MTRAVLLLAALAGAQVADPEAGLDSALVASRALAEGRYREALRAFEALLAEAPEDTGARYGRALALEGLLDDVGAVAELENVVRARPEHSEAWRALVRLLPRVDRAPEAAAAWRRVTELGGAPPPERAALARALRNAGLLEEAAEALADGTRPAERLERGLIAAERGDDRLAAAELGAALSEPEIRDPRAEYQLGRALESLGRREEAALAYRRALEADPRLRSARFRLGSLLLRDGREAEGRELLEGYEEFRQWDRRVKLLRFMVASGRLPVAEHREKALQLVSLLLQGGAHEEAGPLIAAELARRSGDPPFVVARARWLSAQGETAAARETLEPLLGESPVPDALWLSARLLLMQQQAGAALGEFERLLAVDPQPPPRALKEAATAAALAGRPERAESLFRRALQAAPGAADVHADLALLLEAQGRAAEAETSLRRALELDPGLRGARVALAGALERAGALEEEIEVWRAGVSLHPEDGALRLGLARALERAGRSAEAATEREEARRREGKR